MVPPAAPPRRTPSCRPPPPLFTPPPERLFSFSTFILAPPTACLSPAAPFPPDPLRAATRAGGPGGRRERQRFPRCSQLQGEQSATTPAREGSPLAAAWAKGPSPDRPPAGGAAAAASEQAGYSASPFCRSTLHRRWHDRRAKPTPHHPQTRAPPSFVLSRPAVALCPAAASALPPAFCPHPPGLPFLSQRRPHHTTASCRAAAAFLSQQKTTRPQRFCACVPLPPFFLPI